MSDFAERYRDLTPEQLMQVAHEGGLQTEAAQALDREMANRGITNSQTEEYSHHVTRQQLQLRYREKNFSTTRGIKVTFRNPRFLSGTDQADGIECRTRWLSIAWIPLVPLGSFRVHPHPPGPASRYEIVSKEKFDWGAVVRVWSIELGVFLLLILGLHFLDWISR